MMMMIIIITIIFHVGFGNFTFIGMAMIKSIVISFRKGLVPVDWQQRFYVKLAAAS